MKYKASDIEIIILTYNREKMLEDTLISIKNQTLQGFRVLVVDNCSSDNTQNVVEKHGYEFHKNPQNIGQVANFDKAIELSNRKWTMLFHDDDLLHPDYINNTLKLINKYPDLSIVSGLYNSKEELTNSNWQNLNNKHFYYDAKDFARYLILGKPVNFSASIYKNELLKSKSISNDYYSVYGKIFDKVFMLDFARQGKAAILADKKCVRYRIHAGQDTGNPETGPFESQITGMHQHFYDLLENGNLLHKLAFSIRNHKMLMNMYYWIHEDKRPELNNFIKDCIEKKATTKSAIFFGKLRKNLFFLPFRGIIQGLLDLHVLLKLRSH